MKKHAQNLILPPEGKSYWTPPPPLDQVLLYHSWGKRNFYKKPLPAIRHDGPTYLVIIEGSPTIDLGNRHVKVNSPCILYVAGSLPQGWKSEEDSRNVKMLCWIWNEAINSVPFLNDFASYPIDSQLMQKMIWLHTETRSVELLSTEAANNHLKAIYEFMNSWLCQLSCSKSHHQDKIIFEKSLEWIDAHLSSELRVYDLIDHLGINPRRMRQIFLKQTSKSPKDYVLERRLLAGRAMLKNELLSVKEVSYKLGYQHPNDFSRAYKSFFGVSPKNEEHHAESKFGS